MIIGRPCKILKINYKFSENFRDSNSNNKRRINWDDIGVNVNIGGSYDTLIEITLFGAKKKIRECNYYYMPMFKVLQGQVYHRDRQLAPWQIYFVSDVDRVSLR